MEELVCEEQSRKDENVNWLAPDLFINIICCRGAAYCQRHLAAKARLLGPAHYPDPDPKGLSVSHVCPFVLLSPGLLSYWPDLG